MAYRDRIRIKIKRLCLDAMLLGVALMLSYLEAILPLSLLIPLPGFKLGLCNIIITLAFVSVSPIDAAIISLCRILLVSTLFGNVSSFAFSLCGGILSYAGLWFLAKLLKKSFSMIGVSVGCAALHNIGQLLCASFLFGAEVIVGYLPVLLVAALVFGTITGVLLELILPGFLKLNEKHKL